MADSIAASDSAADAATPPVVFTGHRREKVQHEDGRRANRFYLIDETGREHLAAVGEERDTRDGHYTYRAQPPFLPLHPAPWGNASGVQEWLTQIIDQRKPFDVSNSAAAPMDWQPPSGGEKREQKAEAQPRHRHTASGRSLDSWPPPPVPQRSELPLPQLPRIELPKPPVTPAIRSVEEVRSAAVAAKAAALGGLAARAEAEAAKRGAARKAALDWLRSGMPPDETELLRANIAGLAETLAELDALPPPSSAAAGADGFQEGNSLCNRDPPSVEAPEKQRVVRARLVTEALDFLREIGSTFLPLRIQAGADVLSALSAAARHQEQSVAALAQDYIRQLHRSAEVHVAVLTSPDFAADPRAALSAHLQCITATADAVVEREATAAAAAAKAAAAAANAAVARPPRIPSLPKPSAPQPASSAGQAEGQSAMADATGDAALGVQQAATSTVQSAPQQSQMGSQSGGPEVQRATTKPHTPHPKTLLSKLTKGTVAAQRGGSGVEAQQPAPSQQSMVSASSQAASDGDAANMPDGDGGSDSEAVWHDSDDGDGSQYFHDLQEDVTGSPVERGVTLLRRGKGRLRACRFSEVRPIARAVITSVLAQLQLADVWHADAAFVKSIESKAAALQRAADQLDREKTPAENREVKAVVLGAAEDLLMEAEAHCP